MTNFNECKKERTKYDKQIKIKKKCLKIKILIFVIFFKN